MTALAAAAAAAAAGVAAAELLLILGRGGRTPGGRRFIRLARRLPSVRPVGMPVPDDLRARIEAARLSPGVDVRLVMGAKLVLAAGADRKSTRLNSSHS